jgi:hypothetical protein
MIWKLIMALPDDVRMPLLRSLFTFDVERTSSFQCRLAQGYDEYVRAFTVLRRAFGGAGYAAGYRSDRIHYRAHHMLPTSNVIVEYLNGELIGTTTSVHDSAMGLPAEPQLVGLLDAQRHQGRRIGESSSVAVEKQHRGGGAAFFSMVRFYVLMILHVEGIDDAVISTPRTYAELMRTMFGFTPLTTEPLLYPGDHKQTTWPLHLDMHRAYEVGQQLYAGKPLHRNIAHYIFELGKVECELPSTPFHTTMAPRLTPDEYRELFAGEGTVIPTLNDRERMVIRNAMGPELERLFPGEFSLKSYRPRDPRFEADGTGFVEGTRAACRLRDVSRRGALIQTSSAPRIGSEISIDVEVGRGRRSVVTGRVVRETTAGRYGLQLTHVDSMWDAYLDFLHARLWGQSVEAAEPIRALAG